MAGEFGRVTEWFKRHPYATAGIVVVVGGYIIYEYFGSSSSTTSTATDDTAANDAAAVDESEIAAPVQEADIAAQGATQQTQIAANANEYDTAAQAQTTDYANQLAAATSIDNTNTAANVANNELTAQQSMLTNFTEDAEQYGYGGSITGAGGYSETIAPETTIAGDEADAAESLASSQAATALGVASINANASTNIAEANDQAAASIASTNASASTTNAAIGNAGNILTGAGNLVNSIF